VSAAEHHPDCEGWMRDWRDRAHAGEELAEQFRALANAVSDYIEGLEHFDKSGIWRLKEALASAADALGTNDYPMERA
jgi:hypothetical protein